MFHHAKEHKGEKQHHCMRHVILLNNKRDFNIGSDAAAPIISDIHLFPFVFHQSVMSFQQTVTICTIFFYYKKSPFAF